MYEKAREASFHCSVSIGFWSHLRCERKPIWTKTPTVCFWKGLSGQSSSSIPIGSRRLFVHPLRGGTCSGAGNGDYREELRSACRAIHTYLDSSDLPHAMGLVHLDGQDGDGAVMATAALTSLLRRHRGNGGVARRRHRAHHSWS